MALISYQGQLLPTFDPATYARIEGSISPSEVYPFLQPRAPQKARDYLPAPLYPPLQPIKLGTLNWPTGAARWATAFVLCDDATLKKLQPMISITSPGTLQLDQVKASMYLLPALPIWQDQFSLWLLPLVDVRYTWWQVAATIPVVEGVTDWPTLIGSIAKALGITIVIEQPIPAAYLYPPGSLASQYEYLPQLLDAVLYSVGLRLVSPLMGTIYIARNATQAKIKNTEQIGVAQGVRAGGLLRFDPTTTPNDLNATMPASVTVTFPQQNFGLDQIPLYKVQIALAGLHLIQLPNIVGVAGNTQAIHSSACYRSSTDPDGGNAGEITALATQIAVDYYLWRQARVEARIDGIVTWPPDGFSEIEWTHRGGMVATTIRRPPWNTEPLDLAHRSTPGTLAVGTSSRFGGTGPHLFGRPLALDQPTTFRSRRMVQEGTIAVVGTINDLMIPDCTLLRINASVLPILTGIANPASDMEIQLVNIGTVPLLLANQSGSQTQNQFLCPDSLSYTVDPQAGVLLCYDSTSQKWRIVDAGSGTASLGIMGYFGSPYPITFLSDIDGVIETTSTVPWLLTTVSPSPIPWGVLSLPYTFLTLPANSWYHTDATLVFGLAYYGDGGYPAAPLILGNIQAEIISNLNGTYGPNLDSVTAQLACADSQEVIYDGYTNYSTYGLPYTQLLTLNISGDFVSTQGVFLFIVLSAVLKANWGLSLIFGTWNTKTML